MHITGFQFFMLLLGAVAVVASAFGYRKRLLNAVAEAKREAEAKNAEGSNARRNMLHELARAVSSNVKSLYPADEVVQHPFVDIEHTGPFEFDIVVKEPKTFKHYEEALRLSISAIDASANTKLRLTGAKRELIWQSDLASGLWTAVEKMIERARKLQSLRHEAFVR